ncbi:3-dehydroquinate dehydratase [Achromatium sp. WMS2]|nr:3-dehydroquinate dehydratase [Achromatium sp. WMS2]
MATIQFLNGPNLNLLGTREPRHYGNITLKSIQESLERTAVTSGHKLWFMQTNAEHVLVEAIHSAGEQQVAFIVINPAAFTHTSVAIRDALLGVAIPFIEVHLSNIYSREPFRTHSYFSDIALGVISGLGSYGYELAFQAALRHLDTPTSHE